MNDATSAAVRLDVWLWAARFFKTRSLAKQAVEGGKVELNGVGGKPAKPVRVGDRLVVNRAGERYEVEVLGLSEQRGPAPVAQQLYSESEASRIRREAEREQRRLSGAGAAAPATRPDKKSRRQIRALKDGGKGKLPPWFPP